MGRVLIDKKYPVGAQEEMKDLYRGLVSGLSTGGWGEYDKVVTRNRQPNQYIIGRYFICCQNLAVLFYTEFYDDSDKFKEGHIALKIE